MKTVYLLRNAKAENGADGQADIERKLTHAGREACATMGTYIKARGYLPALVLCSPAERTRETFELVMQASGFTPASRMEKKLYMSSPDQVISLINRLDEDFGSVMVVGHNPVMHHLAILRAQKQDTALHDALQMKYPTGTLTVLRFALDFWHDLAPGRGELVDFMPPSGL